MSADMNPSLVNWLTTMMSMRLQVILEHMPVTEEQILQYVRRVGDPPQVIVSVWAGIGWLWKPILLQIVVLGFAVQLNLP